MLNQAEQRDYSQDQFPQLLTDDETVLLRFLESLGFSIELSSTLVDDYHAQMTLAAQKAWGSYWPEQMKKAGDEAHLYRYIAQTVTRAAIILQLKNLPRLGLLDGFFALGKMNFRGWCWEEDGHTWVGLDENWFNSVVESIVEVGNRLSPELRREISRTLAEEMFHAWVREMYPKLAEENIKANASLDQNDYRNSLVERIAKRFAELFVLSEGK